VSGVFRIGLRIDSDRQWSKTARRSSVVVISVLLFAFSNLARAGNDFVGVRALIESARKTMLIRPDAALAAAERSEVAARAVGSDPQSVALLIEAQAVQAQALIRLGKIDRAEAIIQNALKQIKIVHAPSRVKGDLLLSFGQIARRKGNVQSALGAYQDAYRLFRSAGERRWQSIALQSIGPLYTMAGDSESALKYFSQADEEYSGDPLLSLSNRNNRGNAYLAMQQPANAELQFRSALESARRVGSQSYVAQVLANIAQAQVSQGHLGAASSTVANAFAAVQTNGSSQETWSLWVIRAQIAYARGDYKNAAASIDRALNGVDPATSESPYRGAHDIAYKIYRAIGRDKLALIHLEARARIDEADAKLTASTSAALMAARFDFANQDLKISQLKAAQLEKSVAFERARATLQRNLLIVIVIGSIVIGSMLIVGLILITRSRNRERAAKLVLADTNRELEKAIAAKMEFLATTSHEIRTPLNGILGMTQVMLADRKLDATLRDRIGIVHSAGENMRTLVDDILDVAKMETGKLAVGSGTIDLKATLRQVAQVWRLQAEAAGIGLILHLDDCPDRVEGDAGRLRQIVFNLLSNAMKFTEKGKVELIAKSEEGRLRISVRDSGIGISREWHESIFELFQQVDGGTTRQYGGTGLGLAICRNLARAMGGDISVESEPGFGSTFTIELPLVFADARGVANADTRSSRTILVIERNPLTRGILRAVLSERFDVITFVSSDAEAVDTLAHGGVHWIIVDAASVDSWDMIDGSIPTVVIEGTATVPEALHGSVRAVLTKPISKSALLGVFDDANAPVAVAA
jgi:signal transduction histidine kinase